MKQIEQNKIAEAIRNAELFNLWRNQSLCS